MGRPIESCNWDSVFGCVITSSNWWHQYIIPLKIAMVGARGYVPPAVAWGVYAELTSASLGSVRLVSATIFDLMPFRKRPTATIAV